MTPLTPCLALDQLALIPSTAGSGPLLPFVLYLGLTVGIGLWAARRGSRDDEGFFLGGRRMSGFVVALSAVSSGRSAWLVLGASAAAYKSGLSAVWLFPGYVLAELVLLGKIGPRLRRTSSERGAITVPEVLEGRGASRWPVRQVAGLIIVLFLTSYVSAQLVAGGKALEALFPEVDGSTYGLVITASIVLVYTLLGGYRAVALTDVVQGLLMLTGLVLLPLFGLAHVGGWSALFEQLRAVDPGLVSWSQGWGPMLAGVAIGLGSFGSPPILVRAMSIADEAQLARAAWIGFTWNTVMAAGALAIGLVGRAIWTTSDAFPRGDAEHLYPMLGQLVSDEFLFAGFAGVLLAALFAAVMSTCDSQLLVIASSIVRDFKRADETSSQGVMRSRLAVFVALAVAVAISFGAQRSVEDFVLFSWDALGAGFGPALCFVLFRPRTRSAAVLTSMLVGVISVVLWAKVPELKALVHQRVPAFALAWLVLALWPSSAQGEEQAPSSRQAER